MKPMTKVIDSLIRPAKIEELELLAELYSKQLSATGFGSCSEPGKRDALISLVKSLCEEKKLWVISDSIGPITLGHYEPDLAHVVAVVTRDDMERKGYGTRMLRALTILDPLVKVCPVTSSGKALARKCGFFPRDEDDPFWFYSTSSIKL